MNRKSGRGRRRVGFVFEAVGLLLLALFVGATCSGCSSADAGVLTDADRAFVATELAFVSIDDGGSGVSWKPLDDRPEVPGPAPAPRPFTGAKSVAITNGAATRLVDGVLGDPVDISYAPAGSCSDGSCSEYSEAGDRPRRPLIRAAGATGRFLWRAPPIRRIGGFLFRRR